MKSFQTIPFWIVVLSLGMIGYGTVLIKDHEIHLKEAKYQEMVKNVKDN